MPWNSTAPDGTQSVKANESTLQDNTTYTETEMNKDHYWNTSANQDGHHTKVEMDNQAAAPALSAGMDGMFYALENVSSQPYFQNTADIMQLLGIRACAVFDSAGALAYSYNVSGVVRDSAGKFTITYSSALPNTNYLVLGGAMRNDADTSKELIFYVQAAAAVATTKGLASVKVMCKSDGGSLTDPLQMWAVCFGG